MILLADDAALERSQALGAVSPRTFEVLIHESREYKQEGKDAASHDELKYVYVLF
jgi:hypothetical protein